MDNPPAFPLSPGDVLYYQEGMSLRDWFASQADQPGVSEIVAMAGHTTDGFWVEFADCSEKRKFNDWWNDVPLSERCLLSARVRYAMADAMLEARSTPTAQVAGEGVAHG